MADPVPDAARRPPLTGFDQFYEQAFRRVVGRMFLVVGNVHLAEELAQDAMVQIMDQWGERRDRSVESNVAWTVAIAVNLARRHWRSLAVRARAVARLAGRGHSGAVSLDVEAIERMDTYGLLATLPRRQREIATLSVLCDMPAEEIAAVLGISASAVRTHMQRVRKRLAGGVGKPLTDAGGERS
ncbi:sigma-70 family RNA polymerase sigma factor [Dactylosporangium aurantiacum]|uniref:Sigma-70 family RNA polymerase sigma factor n=1 Tax=Dactylosporangium aurantiacum TaxID=35754 RepID=A0A9Q9IG44_9ACTN|nr:sigma-70 family RNA polymerase sigma factor [Dactylosporangium aurantiacum]MDG6101385.1 sigma-70 family RNA polymerase sigma factor [Dactylosporangium aurantiacum]UWZ52759.1 sigma-70 family RNA polymerase sigma factor [Dactylosporangium aurantiacum]